MAKILVVEDDALALNATAFFLSDLGHEVEKACSLHEAKVAVAVDEFDLFVVDLKLPDGWGEELLGIGTPAIVLSGLVEQEQTGRRTGPVEYMSKPAEPDQLEAVVRRLCGEQHTRT